MPYSVRVLPCCRVPSAPVLGQSAAPLSARTALPGCALARARLSVALSASHRILSHVAAHATLQHNEALPAEMLHGLQHGLREDSR